MNAKCRETGYATEYEARLKTPQIREPNDYGMTHSTRTVIAESRNEVLYVHKWIRSVVCSQVHWKSDL